MLADLDVDVASFEAARSDMALLTAFAAAGYAGGVGPGVYDVHSPHVPTAADMTVLVQRAVADIGRRQLGVNPDCGLKTRRYAEVTESLAHLVAAAHAVRAAALEEEA
ncbi:MAG: hypothetical protein ACRD0Z_01460 [Acidimicrobiales bacterium]